MMGGSAKAIMVFGLCLLASQAIAQPGPPPGPPQQPPPPPQPQQPPPGQGDGDQPPRERRAEGPEGRPRLSWYNGDYAAESIAPVMMIDDPVTGFGNEALWANPAPLPDARQSDIAGSAEPD